MTNFQIKLAWIYFWMKLLIPTLCTWSIGVFIYTQTDNAFVQFYWGLVFFIIGISWIFVELEYCTQEQKECRTCHYRVPITEMIGQECRTCFIGSGRAGGSTIRGK